MYSRNGKDVDGGMQQRKGHMEQREVGGRERDGGEAGKID